MALAGLIGGVAGAALYCFARLLRMVRDRSFLPTALAVIASYYVLFVWTGAGGSGFVLELTVCAVFTALAGASLRVGPALAAGGILLHALYDLVHHLAISAHGSPPWWPAFCGALDLVFGGAIAVELVSARAAAQRAD